MRLSRQAQPTSGAVSTTQIGDFLTASASEKSGREILEKLVATPLSTQAQPPQQDITPVQKAINQPAEIKPDGQLLSELTKVQESITSIETEPVRPAVTKEDESQVKKNILEQLAGRSGTNSDNNANQQAENPDGDSTNG